jgi:Fur family peroxide stress response transcriptional regulator
MRKTQARQAIIDFLTSRKQPTSAKEIVEAVACDRPDINKSTVYRFIKVLTDSSQLATIPIPGKGALYELRKDEPHYHFTCERCEEVVCMERESSQLKQLVPRGYSVSPEQLVLSGICPACK